MAEVLVELEAALAPFAARPHWGKLFLAEAGDLIPLYPRHSDFVELLDSLDPRGAFTDDWLRRCVLGGGQRRVTGCRSEGRRPAA